MQTLADTLDIDGADAIAILGLTSVALIVGAITIALTIDVPGDGPSRATLAYIWSKHPGIQTHGIWLPGFSYLAGLCLMLMPNPLLAPRLYNLGLSALTIPAFYALVRKLYGSPAALLSTVALLALPLRIGLGASSLTDGSFLFFLIAAMLCLTMAVERAAVVRIIPLSLSLFFFGLAEMTRYEVWPLVPLILSYLYAQSRRISITAFATAALLLFPIAWSVGNYLYFGNFLYPFSMISHPLEGGDPVGIVTAIAYLSHRTANHLGWLLPIGAIAGLTSEIYRTMWGRPGAQRAAYAVLVCAVWAMIFEGTLTRGHAMYDRYLICGLALALPLAAIAYLEVCGRHRHSIAIGTLGIAASLSMSYYGLYPLTGTYSEIFVTRTKPTDIVELVRWLPTSPYRNDAVLFTKLDWQSSYFPLFAPDMAERYFIVSVWSDEASTRAFIEYARPTLLITQRKDEDDRVRIFRILGRSLPPALQKPVYTTGPIEVYDMSSMTSDHHS